ncbi:AAA ATPase [Chloropicon primus]|uniref:AAA ATPase n=1 Tax=Chloropicon primus TaxID=1764295 RepID=A0A5B8MXF7_9CHLO|nr:AAA ATPase [Chloropicon primus]|eukprot:QDZ24160.1 AAA ATPase [Chloropicon primus]
MMLSPTQAEAKDKILRAKAQPVIKFALRPGFGTTTIFRFLARTEEKDVGLLSVEDVLNSGSPLDLGAVWQLAVSMWKDKHFLLVDTLDLVALPSEISLPDVGRSSSQPRTQPEPVTLLKALADHAILHKKSLVFSCVQENTSTNTFLGSPLIITSDSYTVGDYAFFLSQFATGEEPLLPLPAEVFRSFPQLSPAELRVLSHGDSEISAKLHESHGAVDLKKVERVNMETMPGMQEKMKILEEQVCLPMENVHKPGSMFAEPKRGVLLFGSPGTGKTSIGRWMAHRLKGRLFMVREMHLWKGLQETFSKAEASAPSVVFFDDIDVLLHRSKVAWGGGSEMFRFLLSKMDGMTSSKDKDNKHVTIVMTCESPKSLPDALIRSGRIELWLKLEYPMAKDRAKILTKYLSASEKCPALGKVSKQKIDQIANRTEDFSAADLRRCVKDCQNILASSHSQSGEEEQDPGKVLEKAVHDLRKMRDEVESFMKQMYH